VGGYRAGEDAAKWSRDTEHFPIVEAQVDELGNMLTAPLSRKEGVSASDIYYMVNSLVVPWSNSVYKNGRRLEKALEELKVIESEKLPAVAAKDAHNLLKAAEARNFVLLMTLYNRAALERKESRMVHFREEYPCQDNQGWMKLVLLGPDGKGGVNVRKQNVNLGHAAIMPDKFEKKPAFVVYSMEEALLRREAEQK